MKKSFIGLTLCLIVLTVSASEIEDFRFAVGLYSDQNYQLAKTELESFVLKYSESQFLPNAQFLLANIYLQEELYKQARDIFADLYRSEAADPIIRPEIQLGLAQSYYYTDNHNKAYALFRGFTTEFRNHSLMWKAHYFIGRIEFQNENYAEALISFNNALKMNKDWQTAIHRFKSLLALDMAVEAEETVQGYIRKGTESEQFSQMLILYLNYLLGKKDYEKIVSYAEDYIPSDSQYYDDYLLVVSEALYEKGRFDDALLRLLNVSGKIERADYLTALCHLNMGNEVEAKIIFDDLRLNAENPEVKTNSFFFLAGIEGRTNIDESNRMLTAFVTDYPDHAFIGSAYYQLGFNSFRQNRYDDALVHLDRAEKSGIKEDLREKASYLIAESYFQLQHKQQAHNAFVSYLETYPQGEFVDEALFKTGLYFFERQDYPNALVRFERIVTEFPESERRNMSLFYQGEIFSASRQYDIAMSKYHTVLDTFSDRSLIWLRMAQIQFHLSQYSEALISINNIPDDEGFQFEKNILTGNIYYARRDYINALRSFDNAERVSANDQEWEDAVVRKARALYQLNEYREAVSLYRQLIDRTANDQYLLMAAAAAFTGEDYSSAITAYQRYIAANPDKDNIVQIKLHLADSYYNQKDYSSAATHYQQLINPEVSQQILINSLNGLEWSALQSEDLDYIAILESRLNQESPDSFKLTLYDRKAHFYYSQQQWADVIKSVEFILNLDTSDPKIRDLRRIMAIAQTQLRNYQEAESIFSALNSEKPDPDILSDWAKLHLAQNDSLAALGKLRQASRLTNESNLWLRYLRLSASLDDDSFTDAYERFLTFARNVEREQAQLLWVQWNLDMEKPEAALSLIETLLKSDYEPIKARAQYFKGLHLSKTGNISAAIPELLRVRYLYPRIEDVRLDAEILACELYLLQNDRENALKIYDAIKSGLPQQKNVELRRKLRLED
jgi:TolA-binding protein